MQSTENHTAGLLVTETLSDIILSTAKVLPPVPSRPCGALRGLHDVVRIIGGIAAGARLNHDILRKSASLNPTSLASLCLHECRRVLGDPLGSQREQIILEERLASITAYHFNVGGSAWDCKALFRDPERPLVFVDLPQSHQQQGEVMKTGFDDPIDVKSRREICRSATQLRSILDFHASSHSTSTQGIQHSEVGEDSIGRVPPVNKNTLIAGDGALRVAGVLHALHRQRHMFLIGKPGDQRPAMISLASHIAGLGLVVARGASNEEEFGKHILVALRHAVLTAAKAAAHDPNGPRRKTSKIVVLINDESLAACRSGERSVFQLGSTDNLNISLDVLQAIVRDGDVDGKLFSAYSKATDKEIKDAFHAASSLLAGREGSVTCVGACSSEYTDGNFPVSIRSAIAASTLRSVSIAIALESDSHASLLQHIRLGYPALAALFQMNYHCLDQADKCVASMEHVLRRRLAQLQLDTEFMTVPVNEITSLCCAAFAALDTMPSKETLPSLLMDVADSTPTIAMNWYQGLQSRRRGLLTASDGYQSLVEALPLEMPDLPSDSSGATTTERILCLLSIEAADWSRQLGLIDKRIQSLFADAMMHAIDVRLATGQHSLQGRLSTCAAAKRCLNLTGLSADSFELNGATITYPYEAAVHAKLADVVTERLVFRYANAHPDNELLVSTWRAQGCLPRGISTASLALATVHSLRWPLIIDPDGICTRWIRSAECSAESEFVEVTPATALCARRVLRNSIIRERSLLMNVDKIPVCCSDSTVFEDSLTLQKSVHITSFPGTIGFRLYCVASTSSTVLTNVAITMFNVIVFFIDDVSLRTSLGLSAAATIFHDFETMLNSSFYSVCRATASVSVAENALARVLGVVFNDSECKPPCYKSHASPAVNTSQVFSLVKELDDALVKSRPVTATDTSASLEKGILIAFLENAICALPHESISLFTIEIFRCCAIQRKLVTMDLALGDTFTKATALNHAVSTSRRWQLLADGGMESPSQPSKLPTYAKAFMAQFAEILTASLLLLRLACLPHEAQGTARGIVRDAYDKLTASSHVIQESKERVNLDDLTTHKLNRALSVISGPLSAKKVAGASLLNLLLIGDGFTQDDSIHEDSIFSFVRGLADGTSAPQPGHTVGSPISSNLPDPFDSLASNYRIRIELQFKFNASSGIYGNAEARVLYRALMMRLPQRLELDVIGRCIANPRLDAWLRSLQERVEYLPPFLATDDVAISPGSILAEGFLLFHVSRRLASEVLVTNKNASFFHNSGVAPLLLLSPGPRRSSNLSLKEQPDLNKAVECPVYSYRQSVFIRLLTAHLPAALGPEVCSERTAYLLSGIAPSRYTSLTSLRFTVQWIYASLVAHLYLLYEDTRMRYPLLSFSCTLLVTEESGGCIGSSPLSVARSPPVGRAVARDRWTMLETQHAEISSDQWDQRIGFLDNIYFVLYMYSEGAYIPLQLAPPAGTSWRAREAVGRFAWLNEQQMVGGLLPTGAEPLRVDPERLAPPTAALSPLTSLFTQTWGSPVFFF
ncbi:hypothetical protein AURANDRAFT_66584 [Aureococcus anophagefferens]|uniref:Uncharacterized protein n=1 Tax=Aureococcus anophagefferens TaxID=44056 RepID=F0YI37_AURAN|nr:hypothetical protein AURANDRAFT_66584 [Aureococcus anophagefferens]EGB05235.1 hypothetical protein AURANDRAFT_66584 [Aureococcus anophagefferens]|eukprot:XP_009040136.1 hypothetical protein AURANDRAFT_66584 [Aureococcus anophagefferens]